MVSGASVSESVGSFLTTSYIPRPSKVIKLQPPGLFFVAKGHKFHTLRGFIKLKDVEIVDVVEVVFFWSFPLLLF